MSRGELIAFFVGLMVGYLVGRWQGAFGGHVR